MALPCECTADHNTRDSFLLQLSMSSISLSEIQPLTLTEPPPCYTKLGKIFYSWLLLKTVNSSKSSWNQNLPANTFDLWPIIIHCSLPSSRPFIKIKFLRWLRNFILSLKPMENISVQFTHNTLIRWDTKSILVYHSCPTVCKTKEWICFQKDHGGRQCWFRTQSMDIILKAVWWNVNVNMKWP